jgi:hypothetical protein
MAERVPLRQWLLSVAHLHASVVDAALPKLEAEEVFTVDDLRVLRAEGWLRDIFPARVTAAKIASALADGDKLPTTHGRAAVLDGERAEADDSKLECEEAESEGEEVEVEVDEEGEEGEEGEESEGGEGGEERDVSEAAAAAPVWWVQGMDEKMAEVLFLTDPHKVPAPSMYNDRLAFGSVECSSRFPGIKRSQLLTEAAQYIDLQLEAGGSIRAHWLGLKSGSARVVAPPRPKRRPDLRANGKVWVDEDEDKPFYTDADGRLVPDVQVGAGSSASHARQRQRRA